MSYTEQAMIIAGERFIKEGDNAWYHIQGYVIRWGHKFWAWNSFACRPYLSDLSHSELFRSKQSAVDWATKHRLTDIGQVVESRARGNPSDYFWYLAGEVKAGRRIVEA